MDLKGSPAYDFGWTCIHVTPEHGPCAMCRRSIGTGICTNCLAPIDDHGHVGTVQMACVSRGQAR